VSAQLDCTGSPRGIATRGTTEILEISTPEVERIPPMASGGSGNGGSRSLVLAWDVSADQEEPWRRLLQELSDDCREEEYMESRRRLGVSAESVWLVAKPSGGGVAVICLEADNPDQVLGELAGSDAPLDSWYSGAMRKLFGFDLARVARSASGELLFAWRDDDVPGDREATNNS
jgi:hypothetical protein